MTDATAPVTKRSGSELWAKGKHKIKAVMKINGMWGKERTRSIFGNQFGKGDVLEDMPEIYIERKVTEESNIFDSSVEEDLEKHQSFDLEGNPVGWGGSAGAEAAATAAVAVVTLPTDEFSKKGYKTNVRASISKLKKAAKKVKQFLTVVRLAHDPLCTKEPLSYNEVLNKLREHYDPNGIHSNKHADQHEYYTDLGLLKRESLKHHPEIRRLLDQLWTAADKNSDGGLDKEEYMVMCSKVYKAIVDDSDDPEDQEERDRIAEEDWKADSLGHDTLDYRRFTTAWFQLADHWTHDLSVEAYCKFLGQIKDTVTCMVNGKIVWKDDSNIHHMEIQESEAEEDDKHVKLKEADDEVVVQMVKKKKKIKPAIIPPQKKSVPKLTQPKEKKQLQGNSMVLVEGNPNDKRRNIARMNSRNGLYRGSTVPPPKGWSSTKTNKWGITFTRIKIESQSNELKEAAQSLGVRASASVSSSTLQKGLINSPFSNLSESSKIYNEDGSLQENNGSSMLKQTLMQHEPVLMHVPLQQYYPSSSGGFQSSKFRYPQPFDATVGAIGGGFEWSNPVGEPPPANEWRNNSVGGGSELLCPSWADDLKQQKRPSTAHVTNRNRHGTHSKSLFQNSWTDQLQRPSTASGHYLPSQATLTLVPVDSFSNMLDAVATNNRTRAGEDSGGGSYLDSGGSSILLNPTESIGSIMLENLQNMPVRKKKKKKKRPKTAPGKPREYRFDRQTRGITKSTKGKRQRRRKERSKSPPRSSITADRVTRMRQRSGISNILSPAGIPEPTGTLEPLVVRPMTTGGIRKKKSRRPVKIESGRLFCSNIVRPASSLSQRQLSSSSTTSSVTVDQSGGSIINDRFNGSRILDPTEMRGLPISARNLMNKYAGYDPTASLNEASLSIGGSTLLSSSIFNSSTTSFKRGKREGVNRRKCRGGVKRVERAERGSNRSRKYEDEYGENLGSRMSMSAYMNKLVMPASQRTIKLLNLREDCTVEDIVGVMLAVGATVSPNDVTLSDVSSKTRLRRASVRFSKYKDFKLAVKMLEICNRTEEHKEQSHRLWQQQKRSLKDRPEVTQALWGVSNQAQNGVNGDVDRDGNVYDEFGLFKLSPVKKVKMPNTFFGGFLKRVQR
jgi:uncharacterized protein YihD (DUF1040 family)